MSRGRRIAAAAAIALLLLVVYLVFSTSLTEL
jgi:hypothetical protein